MQVNLQCAHVCMLEDNNAVTKLGPNQHNHIILPERKTETVNSLSCFQIH